MTFRRLKSSAAFKIYELQTDCFHLKRSKYEETQAGNYLSKLTIETVEQGKKYVLS